MYICSCSSRFSFKRKTSRCFSKDLCSSYYFIFTLPGRRVGGQGQREKFHKKYIKFTVFTAKLRPFTERGLKIYYFLSPPKDATYQIRWRMAHSFLRRSWERTTNDRQRTTLDPYIWQIGRLRDSGNLKKEVQLRRKLAFFWFLFSSRFQSSVHFTWDRKIEWQEAVYIFSMGLGF